MSETLSLQQPMYPIRLNESVYILEAGAEHGITNGAIFKVYRDKDTSTEHFLAEVEILKVSLFQSEAKCSSTDVSFTSGFALQTRVGVKKDLTLNIDEETLSKAQRKIVTDTFKALSKIKPMPPRIVRVTGQKEVAELGISFRGDEAVIETLDERVTKHLSREITIPTNNAALVLQAAAHYYRHLLRVDNFDNDGILSKIKVEYLLLEKDPSSESGLRPTSQSSGNILDQGSVDVIADENHLYGIRVTNDSDRDLFPYLFFFDSGTFRIGTHFQL